MTLFDVMLIWACLYTTIAAATNKEKNRLKTILSTTLFFLICVLVIFNYSTYFSGSIRKEVTNWSKMSKVEEIHSTKDKN